MNKVISWLKNVRVRQIVTVFLAGLTVFVMQGFGYGNALQAQADTIKSSEGIYYKGVPNETDNINNDNNLVEKAKKNLKETADNVHENFVSDKAVKTPEGVYYKATPDDTSNINNDSNFFEQAKQNLKETADNIKEKLNLDEPLPPSTKKFLRSTENTVEETVEPVTGTKKGYYQE
ncbi:MAG: hypothetical protein DSM106950_04355 [Stigonema ocellatum SAG 48.90 = DSM 106950]|nr:hypothetical protein [Stigonema ocellatum SAG 48.90 = DSM 106950]